MKGDNNDREQKIREYLRRYDWQWSGELRAPGFCTDTEAQQLFDRWISDLRRTEGGENFGWLRVLLPGIGGGNRRFWFVLAGLRNRIIFWRGKWEGLGDAEKGQEFRARIERFDPEENGILSLLKTWGGEDCKLRYDFEPPKKQTRSMPEEAEQQDSDSAPTTLRIDNIDDCVSPAEMKRMFKKFGRVLEVSIIDTRVNDNRNLLSVRVTMEDRRSAVLAKDEFRELQLRGQEMRVSLQRD